MPVKAKFQLCMVDKSDQASAKLDLTFTNVDLTNVRCQTVIIGGCIVHACTYMLYIYTITMETRFSHLIIQIMI